VDLICLPIIHICANEIATCMNAVNRCANSIYSAKDFRYCLAVGGLHGKRGVALVGLNTKRARQPSSGVVGSDQG